MVRVVVVTVTNTSNVLVVICDSRYLVLLFIYQHCKIFSLLIETVALVTLVHSHLNSLHGGLTQVGSTPPGLSPPSLSLLP